MSPLQRRILLVSAVTVMLASALAMQKSAGPRHTFRVVLGVNDKKPTDWSGQVNVKGGELLQISGWRFAKADTLKGTSAWKCRTHEEIAPMHRYPVQDHDGAPKSKAVLEPWPNGVQVSVRGESPVLVLELAQGTIEFAARDIAMGEPKSFLNRRVRVERLPEMVLLRPPAPFKAEGAVQDDYPAFWVHYKSGKQYLAWIAYQKEKDRVLLVERDGREGAWSKPLEVAGPGQHFRVALATTHGGTLWIVWASQQHGANQRITGNWDLFARPYKDGKLGKQERLTDRPGPDIWHRMTTDNKGRAWLVWQGFDKGQSDIFARCADADGWHEPIKVSTAVANDWDPVVAADTKEDRVWIGWDTYDGDNYGVRVRAISGGPKGQLGPVLVPEKTSLFGAHISLACDRAGRLWAAWDESGPQWGKDTGFLFDRGDGKNTTRLYASRNIRLKCLVNGDWLEPAPDFQNNLPDDMKEYNELGQLQVDTEGRLWLAFRHRICYRPREDGWAAQGGWTVSVTAFLGDRWLPPVEAPRSSGRLDMRISSQRDPQGNVYFAYAGDNRQLPGMAPRNLHVAVSRYGQAPTPVEAKLVRKDRAAPIVTKVHPNEKEQLARIRGYKATVAGKTYRIYRGDLHRHTDISGDGPGDGSLMDLHRYALDAVALDYVMVGDHNMGGDNEYTWWRTQQANDLYTVPAAFISMYGYERSVPYPNGHRNVLWPERGHRTLPLPKPLPAARKADTPRLYEYLRKSDGICTLHTSASDQGTNWADAHDPVLEPFVELFQGYHTSYEAPGAPLAINDKSDRIHGPYKGDGFVSFALNKGYRLGFQASSDHISTHVSYACIYAEEFSRKGLIEAMQKRHTYAATDNIVLDVRLGSHFMGDEVRTNDVRLDVVVLGTDMLDKVEIIRNGTVVNTARPAAAESRFTWQDPAPMKGDRASYYYVRVQQKNGQMAWGSPLWVTVGN